MRVSVQNPDELETKYGAGLASGAVFLPTPTPPAVGSTVVVEFTAADGSKLGVAKLRVSHSRPALAKNDPTAGMVGRVAELDEPLREVAEKSGVSEASQNEAEEEHARRIESLIGADSDRSSGDGPVIGIDLGTTYSCVAVVENTEAKVLELHGHSTFPSVVHLDEKKQVKVGNPAVDRMVLQPAGGIYGSKRFLGRPFTSAETQTYGHFFNYDLTASREGRTAAKVNGVLVPLETVAAYLIAFLVKVAERNLGKRPSRAVVTVPAYFNEGQRRAVRQAGEQAKIEVERVLSEPTAAAVAYGYGRGLQKTILVYDLGGGTFDATLLRLDGDAMEVLATGGDPFLGGSDFDDRITEYLLVQIEKKYGVGVRGDPVAVQRIRLGAEMAKRDLSDAGTTTLEIPYLTTTDAGPLNAMVELDRGTLTMLTEDLVVRTLGLVQEVLDRAQTPSDQLDDIILVGGQSRTPMVAAMLSERFGRRPAKSVHPDHAVALGAALVGAAMDDEVNLDLRDVLSASVRRAHCDGSTTVLFPAGHPLPAAMEIELETVQDKQGTDFRLDLYSGEQEQAEANIPLGRVRMPSSLAISFAKKKAVAVLEIDEQGLMKVSATHPVSNQETTLEVSLNDLEKDNTDFF